MRTFRGVILASLIVATPLVLTTPAFAQNNPPPRQSQGDTDSGVGFGALGGFNRTSIRGDAGEGINAGSGPMFGIWFGGNRNGRVGFMGEASWVQKKATDIFGDEIKVSYFEIPALFRINIGNRSRDGVSVYALAGPAFDFKLSEKFNGEDVGDDEAFKGVDIGLMIGGGVEVNRFGFEVRGNWGLKNIAEGDEVISDIKTFTIQFVGKFRIN